MLPALLLTAVLSQAHAQVVPDVDPGVVPSPGLATENGAAALYVNPSNLAYDADPRWGAFLRWSQQEPGPWSGAVTGGASFASAGFRFLRRTDGLTDLALNLGVGIPLPKRFAVGAAMHWHLLAQRRNLVAFDAAASWRPLSWFGVTILSRSIGNPGDDSVAVPQTGAGVAFRPLGRALTIGVDYLHTFRGPSPRTLSWRDTDVVQVSLRVRPARGVFLRSHLDSNLSFGLGLEAYFAGVGFGVAADRGSRDDLPDAVVWIGTDEPDEHAAPPRRQVTDLVLDTAPPYEASPQLVGRPERTWWDVLEQFDAAARDRTIRGMLLTLGDTDLGDARWSELADAIRRLRVQGKQVVVHLLGTPGDGAIRTAAAADRVYAHPSTTLDLTGPSITRLSLRGTLDLVGVDVQVTRTGDFKTAGEPYTEVEPSDADRVQQRAILDQRRGTLIDALATGRARPADEAARWVDGGPWTAQEAESMGLIDGRAYPDQVRDTLEDLFGGRVARIDLARAPVARSAWDAPDQVALIHVDGPIVSRGTDTARALGLRQADAAEIERRLLRAARTPEVRAVVLRIDSPGGSTFASDQVWRAVQRVRATGRPVVVSMGNVAASGGYYVATAADAIWAEPGTLTGSIGVIAVRPNVAPLMDRLGVTVTTWSAGRHAGFDTPLRPLDPLQQARMQALVDDGYARFLDRVVRGRDLTPDAVEAVARGRVWTGTDALEHGLIDEIGGLTEAVADARRLAGIPPRATVDVVDVGPRRRNLVQVVAGALGLRRPQATLGTPWAAPAAAVWWLGQAGHETVWMLDPSLLAEGAP